MWRGWHYTQGGPTDTQPPMDAATTLDNSPDQALRSANVLMRLYFTGRPTPQWVADKLLHPPCVHLRNQLANEMNLPQEGFGGGPDDYAAWFLDVVGRVPSSTPCYYGPPSPGLLDWQTYYTSPGAQEAIEAAAGISVHAYGNYEQMVDIVTFVATLYPNKPIWVSEVNFGAGNTVDVNTWAHNDFLPFLNFCATLPNVEAVTYFAYWWDQSAHLPTSVDGQGTSIESVLHAWVPPASGGSMEQWYPNAIQRPISRNYTAGRGGHSPNTLVMHIADGYGSPYNWFNQDRGRNGSSAHFWVSKTGKVEQYRPMSDTCWANGPICEPDMGNPSVGAIVNSGVDPNQVTVAVEHEGRPGDVFPAEQVASSHALLVWLGTQCNVQLTRDHVIGHYQLDDCTRQYCPGDTFPWESILGTQAYDPTIQQLQANTWALCDQLQALAASWTDEGWPSLGAGIGAAAESIKTHVRSSKGEH